MCHLILMMPLLALPVFWLMPLGYSVPSYIAVVLVSAILYWVITRAMKQPIQDDFRSLVGNQAEIVSCLDSNHLAQYLVRSRGELWSAHSKDTFQTGDLVNIVAVQGNGMVVEMAVDSYVVDKAGNAGPVLPEVEDNERYCH